MYSEDQIKDFYQNYRESLSRQKESALQNLNQQRNNAYSQIMSGANKAGMMYSNFPTRSKIQYDMGTYTPAQNKIFTTYQTGLDSLRNNIVKYQNSIKDIQDAIAHLNTLSANGGGSNNSDTLSLLQQLLSQYSNGDGSNGPGSSSGADSGNSGGGGGGGGAGGR